MKNHFLILFLALTLLSCNQSQNFKPAGSSSAQPQAAPMVIDKATAGAITGIITFQDTAPKLPALDMTQDPACPTTPQSSDVVAVKDGKLANVFIYVKEGLGQGSFAAPSEPAVLDQKGCRYVPHVLGMMAGQKLKVLNDDTAQHNVHPMPRDNPEWNETQMPRGDAIEKTFQHSEIMMPVQCNQHPWMKMYLNVMPNPFFAVSGADGTFQIKDLPPGEYTLAAVHEKFGERTIKIKVDPKQTAKADFSFQP
jgi:plastocyanin